MAALDFSRRRRTGGQSDGGGDVDAVGVSALATNLARLARRHPAMSPEEQTAVRHLVGRWGKDD